MNSGTSEAVTTGDHRPPPRRPLSERFKNLTFFLQDWRDQDEEDALCLSRSDVIEITTGIYRLSRYVTEHAEMWQALKGAEIALARDEDTISAMRCILEGLDRSGGR